MTRILVSGATGKLGRIVTGLLLERQVNIRVLTRRPDTAHELFGNRVEIASGDFADAASLRAAAKGADRAFLLSPIDEHLVRDQRAFIDAAVAGGVRRIVKISGSDWTVPPTQSSSGAAHFVVEQHLEAQPIETVALRPSAWMQVSLPPLIAAAVAGRPLYSAYGDASLGFIDARDIAAVAVDQLLADRVEAGPLVLTGSESVSVGEIAATLSRLRGHAVAVTDERPAGAAPPFPPDSFHSRAVAEFMVLIRDGAASSVTDTVPRLLGRAPRTVEAFLSEHLPVLAQ